MKFRFYIALWVGKLISWFYTIRGRKQDDFPGSVIHKICPDFLQYVHKPKYTIAVTGTNGKTVVTSLLAQCMQGMGYKVAYNDWGANLRSGHCILMARSVNWRGRPCVNAVILEIDEETAYENLSALQPDCLVVTNICRDSLERNAHPFCNRDRIQKAIDSLEHTKIVLNADDPISCFMDVPEDRVRYFAIDGKPGSQPEWSNLHDFTICPNCFSQPKYLYSHYLHLRQIQTPVCGLQSPDPDYEIVHSDMLTKQITVREKSGIELTYTIRSSTIFNTFNYLTAIACLRTLGFNAEQLTMHIRSCRIPQSRETHENAGGIDLYTVMCKGQAGSSASVVFRQLAKINKPMELILLMNETYEHEEQPEAVSWLYDTDFELLSRQNIRRIVVAGPVYADYHLRLRLAGIPESRIVCFRDYSDITDNMTFDGIREIYILHEVHRITQAHQLRDAIRKKLGGGRS